MIMTKKTTWVCFYIVFSSVAYANQHVTLTELDKHLVWIGSHAEMQRYMDNQSIDSEHMMKLLDANLEEQLAFTDSPKLRDIAMSRTLRSMTYTDVPQSLERMMKYAQEKYPERVRATAVSLYLNNAENSSFNFATNVMLQTWRSSSEHNRVRMAFHAQAKSASGETRTRYVDFLKWAIAYDRSGGFRTWDRQLTELDPSW